MLGGWDKTGMRQAHIRGGCDDGGSHASYNPSSLSFAKRPWVNHFSLLLLSCAYFSLSHTLRCHLFHSFPPSLPPLAPPSRSRMPSKSRL